MRTLLQDERTEQAPDQAQETSGKSFQWLWAKEQIDMEYDVDSGTNRARKSLLCRPTVQSCRQAFYWFGDLINMPLKVNELHCITLILFLLLIVIGPERGDDVR